MVQSRKKVAIVGSGCAGLGAAWALKHSDYEVHLFEKSSKLGGHTNTQSWRHGDETVPVDTGFIVMNTATYPNFIRFLEQVGIDPVPTEMTFGVSRDHGAFEWSGEARGVFAQRRNFFRPAHWRMIYDILRFNQFALDVLLDRYEGGYQQSGPSGSSRKAIAQMSIGEYLDREGYSDAFRDDYLIPMTAAVWSTSPDKTTLEFPAKTLIRFMWNHHLLSTVAARPDWLTIPGGSQRYIDAVVSSFPSRRLHVHTSSEVTTVLRPAKEGEGPVTVSWIDGASGRLESDQFEHTILACHGDEVLPLLLGNNFRQGNSVPSPSPKTDTAVSKKAKTNGSVKSPTGTSSVSVEEYDIFHTFQTTENICYLHSDLSLMPKRREVWTSWNYLVNSTPSNLSHPAGVSLTYCMNILQHFPEKDFGPILVTMNPDHRPEPSLTQGKFIYRHPLYTVGTIKAQEQLESVQNVRGVSYCGAWTKYGFHEDGFSSGLRVATEHLGAKLPFRFVDSTYSRDRPHLDGRDYLLRLVLLIVLMGIRVVEVLLKLPVVGPLYHLLASVFSQLLDFAERLGLV